MKASDKPQFSKKWWDQQRPAEIPGAELEKPISRVEKALAEQRKKCGDQRTIDACIAALKAVPPAATKTIKQCDRKKHKDVIAVLKKYDALVREEMDRLEEAKRKLGESAEGGDEDDDASDDQLFEKDYLYKMMKLMKSSGKELRFGFGLNSNAPEASRLLLKRKGKPEQLFKKLKKTKEFSNRLLTFGYAKADPEDGLTLIFRLESGANEPPRILKLVRKFLRADKKLRFRKIKLILPSGKTLEDTEPDTDDTVEQEAVASSGAAARPAKGDQRAAKSSDSKADDDRAAAAASKLREQFRKARKAWVGVRDRAQRDLEVIKDAIRERYMDDREQWQTANQGIQRLDEVMENLNDDLRDVLDAYVATPRSQSKQLADRAAEAKQLLESYLDYVKKSSLMAALDEKEFANVTIKKPLERALRTLSKTIT